MTKKQLIAELHRVKSRLCDALLDSAYTNGTENAFWKEVQGIWKEMNGKDYNK